MEISSVDDKIQVTLTSETPALWVWMELDGIEAKYSDNFFHVWLGHPAKIEVIPEETVSLEEVKKRLKVRSLVDTYQSNRLR